MKKCIKFILAIIIFSIINSSSCNEDTNQEDKSKINSNDF